MTAPTPRRLVTLVNYTLADVERQARLLADRGILMTTVVGYNSRWRYRQEIMSTPLPGASGRPPQDVPRSRL